MTPLTFSEDLYIFFLHPVEQRHEEVFPSFAAAAAADDDDDDPSLFLLG